MTVEQARRYKEIDEFNKACASLWSDIKGRIANLKADISEDNRHLNEFYISEYEKLLGMPIVCQADYENVKWLYNYGNLRTKNEIYVHSGKFHSDCNKRSYLLPLVMFLVGFLPVFIKMLSFWYDPRNVGFSVFAAFVASVLTGGILGCILALIGCAIGEWLNKDEAEALMEQGVHEAAPMAARARTNLTATVVSGAVAAGSIGRSTKNAVKGLTNVDGWKQMK